MTEPDRARQLRRRHMHERQAVIFGVLLAALALAGLGAAAIFTGSLSLPFFARDFAKVPTPTASQDPYPCPPAGALPVAANQITVKVFNATTRVGLAGATGAALTERGFIVASAENATATYDGTARIIFGVTGVAQAYTLAAHIDGAVLVLDPRADASLDVAGRRVRRAQAPRHHCSRPGRTPRGSGGLHTVRRGRRPGGDGGPRRRLTPVVHGGDDRATVDLRRGHRPRTTKEVDDDRVRHHARPRSRDGPGRTTATRRPAAWRRVRRRHRARCGVPRRRAGRRDRATAGGPGTPRLILTGSRAATRSTGGLA